MPRAKRLKPPQSNKLFILYDARAYVDEDEATVMSTCFTEKEAREEGATMWEDYDAVWFEYDARGKFLENGCMRPDIPPGNCSKEAV